MNAAVEHHELRTRPDAVRWLVWTAGFLAFPPAGLAARAVVGPVDGAGEAALAGAVAGAVVGAGQWLAGNLAARRGRLGAPSGTAWAWAAATAGGLGLGLAAGVAVTGYATGSGALAAMGALTGLGVGAAQGLLLLAGGGRRALALTWGGIMPPLFALAWVVTQAVIGADVQSRWAVFGASGALVTMAVLGGVRELLGAPRTDAA